MKKKEHNFELSKDLLNNYHVYNSLAFEVSINYIKALKGFYINLKASDSCIFSDTYINGFIDGLNETINALEMFKAREEKKIDS